MTTSPAIPAPRPLLADLRLTLADVAELAHVRRPVVSVWRRRHASGPTPFPAPVRRAVAVAGRAGSDALLFRASDVADWVETSGLGNNRAFRADVALRAVLDDESGPDRDVAFAGLTALLRLKDYVSEPLASLDADEVLDLADELDPDDDVLYAEIEALGQHLDRFAALADLAAGSAYTPGAAVEALLADRFRTGRDELSRSALAPAALALIADLAGAVGGDHAASGVTVERAVADPYPGCGDLLAAVLGRGEVVESPTAHVPTGDAHRLVRRRLGAHGWSVRPLEAEPVAGAPGSCELPLVVTQVPPVGSGVLDDVAVLDLVDNLVLGLADGQFALVIGPASALIDASSSHEAESVRSALLRPNRLRAAVLLPVGLLVERSRERLALWVLRGGDPDPDLDIADRWTTVADLSGVSPVRGTFSPGVVEDLVTDVVAALGTRDDVARHAFRFSRFVHVRELLAARGSLVEVVRPLAPVARDDGGAAAARAAELVGVLDGVERPALDVRVDRGDAAPVRRARLGSLVDGGVVCRVPGNRLDGADVRAPGGDPAGESRVLGVPELLGDLEVGARVVDRLGFAARYPAGRLTEPGDVVFCTTPRPAAIVDTAGFSVVAFPARVLRLRARGPAEPRGAVGADVLLVPEVLARDVAAQARGTRWRSWDVRLVPADQADDVVAALARVRARRAAARAELARLEELERVLVDGVTTGVVRMRKDEPGS
ncbi:hypothetical protein SAMN05518682_2576 [Cellulosimicrobium aquatile]|uniref:DNA methylase adenine-specific domain-containing protein n=1 Tax=Cellulosimicrobium aquatile TaxID=1612203 RepID=A0A1N6SXW6_9MICO|nr:hypothetical protein [Cellulosimicrobium aquatile]SIQ45931.1 hypothetical protein SAMN05518682_2576 [Cellulosimicrobium aquatile]